MDLSLTIRIVFPVVTFLVIIFYFWKNISAHRKISTINHWINFFIGMFFFSLSFFVYLITPLLQKGEEDLAEFSLGGSLIFLTIGLLFYFEFWNAIYKKNSWIVKIFYLCAGANFILLISHPWEINYIENYGYTQQISEIFYLFLFIEGLSGIIIFSQCIYNIKIRIKLGLESINSLLKDNLIFDKEKIELLERKENLISKNKHLDFIIITTFFGFIIAMIGLFPETFILDTLGAFIVFFPQVYFFSKDEELLLFLFSQRVQEDVKNLQKNISFLQQSSYHSLETQNVDVTKLMEFIEKADTILFKKL